MKTELELNEKLNENDYYPSLFTNEYKSIIILANERVGDKTFSGMIIHSNNSGKIGLYATGWTYQQFKRIPKGSEVKIKIIQED